MKLLIAIDMSLDIISYILQMIFFILCTVKARIQPVVSLRHRPTNPLSFKDEETLYHIQEILTKQNKNYNQTWSKQDVNIYRMKD